MEEDLTSMGPWDSIVIGTGLAESVLAAYVYGDNDGHLVLGLLLCLGRRYYIWTLAHHMVVAIVASRLTSSLIG